jgi:hypothetical protein
VARRTCAWAAGRDGCILGNGEDKCSTEENKPRRTRCFQHTASSNVKSKGFFLLISNIDSHDSSFPSDDICRHRLPTNVFSILLPKNFPLPKIMASRCGKRKEKHAQIQDQGVIFLPRFSSFSSQKSARNFFPNHADRISQRSSHPLDAS